MSIKQVKRRCRGLNLDDKIQAALSNGLSKDKSKINSRPVYKKLNEKTSEPWYKEMWEDWLGYIINIINSNLE
jgi:hypothetical protein